MANPLYGFSLYKSPSIGVAEEYPVIGANNVVFTSGDPVVILSGFANTLASNQAVSPTAIPTVPILGIAAKTVTMASNNQTVKLVTVPIIPIDQSYSFLGGSDGELSLTTHPGLFFSLSQTSTISGQFYGVSATSASAFYSITTPCLCLQVDPAGLGTTGVGGGSRQGVFRFVRSQYNPGIMNTNI